MEPAQIDAQLQSIQGQIVARQFDRALRDLDQLQSILPENPEALYMTAVCHRYKKEFDNALECLARLKALVPEHGRAHQEEGHTYRAMGRIDEALEAYGRACRFNPALLASWRAQLEILSRRGLQPQAKQVGAQLDRLERLPKPLLAVMDLIAQGKLLKAEDICRQFLQKVPHYVEAMRLLADIGMRLGVLDDAEFLLESAVELEPDNKQARTDYIQVLRKRQRFKEALDQTKILLDAEPQNLQFQSLYAVECMQNGDYATAIARFDGILDMLPNDAITLTSKGHALKTDGQYESAVESFRAALRSNPGHGEAYYSLANLKVYSFSDREIANMQEQVRSTNLSHMDHVYLYFALGKAFEDLRDYETSFDYYRRGNHLKKAASRYDSDQMSKDLKAQHAVCNKELFEQRASAGDASPDPIFIVGLPRAGSTLLEQILSSHSQVDGTLELPNILSLSHRLRRRGRQSADSGYPEILRELADDELKKFGQQFITDTRIHRKGAPFFIDKMPNNFRHIGLIHLILPNAKIIDARRDAMACCFSGFKQLFAEGQEFTYDLDDIGRYYRNYVELMEHWGAALPGKVLRVQYEDVVADLETQVRRILDYCSLPFEEACVKFHETRRAVRTPSSEQVRQPIYTSGLEQWRNFEPYLGPLKEALGPLLQH